MPRIARSPWALSALLIISSTPLIGEAQTTLPDAGPFGPVLAPFSWRNVGPRLGGRSIAVAGSAERPNEYYFGATGGGLWKSTNGGTDWYPVTDGWLGSASVGAVAVCEANPDIVYIGTGEAQFRGTMSMGDGVYGSRDGGETWQHLGLASSTGQQAIGRLQVHPDDCTRVFAAVQGDPWGPNPERGVYRTSDAGRSWERVLFSSDSTGAPEIVFDPSDPGTLYSTFWQVRRRPWEADSGGPGSGLFKSSDGGDTWTELTGNPGFPQGRLGKMGVTVSADPSRIYALVEHEEGGVFRSDDAGATWRRMSGNRVLYGRSEYYMRIVADPLDPETVYVLSGNGFFRSIDGGRTYTDIPVPHGDNQALWIAPDDPLRMIQSNDGGANVSVDRGASWTAQDYSTAQMYHAHIIDDFPYWICGGQQDGSSKCLPSDGDGSYWYQSAAGEQGYIAVDPEQPWIHYGGAQRGFIARLDRRTGQRRNIEVWPDNPQGLPPSAMRERFQWTFPIVLSPHDPDVLYVSSQHVWRSESAGQSWQRISPDLTYADPNTLHGEQSIVPNQNTQDYYATVFTVEPSPHEPAVIWAGSDDGLIHVTGNDGASWENVTPPGLVKDSRVSLISASPHTPGKAYAAVERYKMQDLRPYIYRTDDYGATWSLVVTGIEDHHYVRAVKEDPVREGLLFAGTEEGPYVSFDDGRRWWPISLDLPNAQIPDLEIQDDDLVIATYGRGFYILDDVLPVLREVRDEHLTEAFHLFGPADVVRTRARAVQAYPSVKLPRANQLLVHYHLGRPARSVTVEILGAEGDVIRTFRSDDSPPTVVRDDVGNWVNGPGAGFPSPPPIPETGAGMHRVAWDLRYPPATTFEGMRLRGANANGPFAPPGRYGVRVTVDGTARTASFEVQMDPRLVDVTLADLVEQFELGMDIHARLDTALTAVAVARDVKEQVEDRMRRASDADLSAQGQALVGEITDVEGNVYQYRNISPSGALQHGIRLTNKIANLLWHTLYSADARPTDQTYEAFTELSGELGAELIRFEAIYREDLERFNDELRRHGLAPVRVPGRPIA